MSKDPSTHSTEENSGDDFNDFFESSLNGYLIVSPEGNIQCANSRFAHWVGYPSESLRGKRMTDLLAIGGRIFYETHLAPLLRMQGYFDEIAVEFMTQNGKRFPAFINALEQRDDQGKPLRIHLTVFKAVDRRVYEQNLLAARRTAEISLSDERQTSALREQFIAVLSHDLRNPLSAIIGAADVLKDSRDDETILTISEMIQRSANRMALLISDVMDFARGRLGGGIALHRSPVMLEPFLTHIADELRSAEPGKRIVTDLELPNPVNCDVTRISQLFSNLVGNALSHGASDGTVFAGGFIENNFLVLSVANSGTPIPAKTMERLFEPFTRNDVRSSLQGLGLGLYISSEIAKAHGGTLVASSNNEETRFTFRMPLEEK